MDLQRKCNFQTGPKIGKKKSGTRRSFAKQTVLFQKENSTTNVIVFCCCY